MRAEQQYIDLFSQCEAMICRHSAEVLNAPRAQAFADFEKLVRQHLPILSDSDFRPVRWRSTNIRM